MCAAGRAPICVLLDQILLEDDQVVRVGRIPADADDVEAQRHREMDELTLMVQALAADVLVAAILGPGLLSFVELAADAVTAKVGVDGAQPVIKHAGLELETAPESNGPLVQAGQQRQRIVSAHEAT